MRGLCTLGFALALIGGASSPSQGSFVSGSSVTFSGQTDAPASTLVVVTALDGNLGQHTCATTVGKDRKWSCKLKLDAGGYTWTATAGAGVASAPIDFVLRGPDPRPPPGHRAGPDAPLIDHLATPTRNGTPTFSGSVYPKLDFDDYGVVVYENGRALCSTGSLRSAAWSCTSSALADGPHVVAARVVKLKDGTISALSNPSLFVVKTSVAPLTFAPVPSPTSDNHPTFSGTGEPSASVTARESGTVLCTGAVAANARWSCAPANPLPDGTHTVSATQSDGLGTVSNSASITFVVDTHIPPAPTLDAPASPTSNPRVTFTGTGEAQDTVRVADSYQHLLCSGVVGSNGRWSCSPPSPLDDGDYLMTAVQTTPLGKTSGPSAPQLLSVRTLTAPLFDALQSPTRENRPTFSGSATLTVQVLLGETVVCTAVADAANHWSCRAPQALADGTYLFVAQVTDGRGHVSGPSASRSVTIDTTPPAAPVLEQPASPTRNHRPVLSGSAEAASSVSVTNGTTAAAICTAKASDSGSFQCSPPADLPDGSYTVSAVATDLAGNTSLPAQAVPLRIDALLPPAPTIDFPADGSSIVDSQPVVTGHTQAGTTVQVTLDGAPFIAQGDAGGKWTLLPPSPLAVGEHHVVAVATDADQNASDPSTSDFLRVASGVVRGGCASGGLPWPWVAALALLLFKPRRRTGALLALVLLPVGGARAQQTPTVDLSVFRPGSGGDGFAAVEGARPPTEKRDVEVRTWTDFSVHPLVLVSETGAETVIVRSAVREFAGIQAHVYGPFSVAVQMPLTLSQQADLSSLPPGWTGPTSLPGGVGNLRVTPRLGLLRQEHAGVDLAMHLAFDFPTASAKTLASDDGVSGEVLLALGHGFEHVFGGRLDLLANAFFRDRPARKILDVETGNEGGARLGLGYVLGQHRAYIPHRFYGELEGRTFLSAGFAAGSSPAEWRLGTTVCPVRNLTIDLAGGGAISDGIGAPRARFVFGLGWSQSACAPAARPVQEEPVAVAAAPVATPPPLAVALPAPPPQRVIADRDGDGIPDEDDTCPDEAGPPDNHGCPTGTRHLVIVSRSKLEILEQVRFESGKSTIQPESLSLLDQVAAVLKSHPDLLLVRVEGHTDDRGSAVSNLVLSQARADAVVSYLESTGVARDRLEPTGYGLSRPIATNKTAAGRATNRRVAFTILRTRSQTIEAERPPNA